MSTESKAKTPADQWVVVQVKSALGPAFRSVGLTSRALNDKRAAVAIPVLRRGILKLEAQPYLYPALEAVKTWGPNGDKPLEGLKRILTNLEQNPGIQLSWSDS